MTARRLVIRVNTNARMSRGKYAAQAVHAALLLLGVHPRCPVIVLGGSRTEIEDQDVVVRDAGRTEVEPGTVTAGASWEGPPPGPAARRVVRVLHAAFGPAPR